MDEIALYNRYGKAVYRVCGRVLYDYLGKPRGYLVGKTIYDSRGEHRGFFHNQLVLDRMGRILGYADGAKANGLSLPPAEIPPVPYKNLPAPQQPVSAVEREFGRFVPAWSMMRLDNMLV